MKRRAFVTGGTGFLGLNMVQALLAQDWAVTAIHRASSDLQYLSRFAADRVVGSITDAASLRAAIPDGTDTIFHVAGNTNFWRGGNAEQWRDNVEGTRNVVEAAIQKGVRRLVVTSSTSAYGPVSGIITEETPMRGGASWVNYEKTKYEAQEIARAATSRGLEVVILQPGGIVGAWDIGTWSRLFFLIRDNKLPGVPPAQLSFGHVREITLAHITAADKGKSGEHYLLAGTDARMLDLIAEIARLLNKKVPTSETPKFLISIIAHLSDFMSRFTGKAPTLTPEMAAGLGGSISVPSTKAQHELDYKLVPLNVMVKDCYDWMRAEHLL